MIACRVSVAYSRGSKAFLINHFEAGQPGSFYKTTLTKDRDGLVKVIDTEVSHMRKPCCVCIFMRLLGQLPTANGVRRRVFDMA